MKSKVILGLCCFNHDSSACVIKDDKLIAFAEEERFNLQKHTSSFPSKSLKYCLKQCQIDESEITDIAFYFNPKACLINYLKKNNPFNIFFDFSIFKRKRFFHELVWLFSFWTKIHSIKKIIRNSSAKLHFIDHHDSHVYYGIFSSHFQSGVVLSNDSIGENISTLAAHFEIQKSGNLTSENVIIQDDPHSIGYLYGAVTEFLGFKRGSDEGKVMALASFGTDKYVSFFENHVELKQDGKFAISNKLLLNRSYQPKGGRLGESFLKLFQESRKPESPLTQLHYDIAYGIQNITEKILIHQVKHLKSFSNKICVTGGVAQNSVANGILCNLFPDIEIFVPPVPHDAGCSMGAALVLYYKQNNKLPEYTETAFLGEKFSDQNVIDFLENSKIQYQLCEEPIELISQKLSEGKVVAFFRREMEGGPRALCHRSIIADPSFENMLDHLNKKVKFREGFRPYGGFILNKDLNEVLDCSKKEFHCPYMSFVFSVKKDWQKKIASLVHVDGTCRIQTVNENEDKFLAKLLSSYKKKRNVPLLINTSLNVRGQPIARSPREALSTFYSSAIDLIVFNDKIIVEKPGVVNVQ